ncbi:dihydroorotase [Azospirillum doebereinerae]|uniref:dihydroorotase n=1 Tax=Azospirillum doebereinerae TaxID=92933 RepID=UPI00384E6DF2
MPNLKPPVAVAADAVAYRDRILAALPDGVAFTPLMTAYLTDGTDPADLARGFEDGVFAAAKLYPANATTNSAHGVTDIARIAPVLERMAEIGMPLLIHGEVTDQTVDIFDREAVFIDTILAPLLERYPTLRVVLEHVTTADAVAFVRAHADSGRIGATITAHHLLINRSHLFQGGIRPHLYCLPIAKRETHRVALVEAATSGEAPFFLGTDTAPHTVTAKETACGCAGCFTAANALELYAEAFDEAGALDKLEAFASLNGPRFYGLPPAEERVMLGAPPLGDAGRGADQRGRRGAALPQRRDPALELRRSGVTASAQPAGVNSGGAGARAFASDRKTRTVKRPMAASTISDARAATGSNAA